MHSTLAFPKSGESGFKFTMSCQLGKLLLFVREDTETGEALSQKIMPDHELTVNKNNATSKLNKLTRIYQIHFFFNLHQIMQSCL